MNLLILLKYELMVMKLNNQGIWAGMIFGGTATQTLILCWITLRCDWDKEVIS
jgi:MATE family multidrug resistance protein